MKICSFCLIVLALFNPRDLVAQAGMASPCSGKMLDDLDSVKGSYTRAFKDKLIVLNAPGDELLFDLKQFNDALVVSVLITGAGDCLDETSKMTINFTSGRSITLKMDGTFNCDREFAAFFGGAFGKKKEFRMLMSEEIATVRVETRRSIVDKTRKNFVEVTFSKQQAQDFIQRLECLVDE